MVLWGITTYFNPCGYKKRYNNYVTFRYSSLKQNLKLITIELSINDSPFVLKKDMSDILVQVKSNSVLWHKEQLLNVAISHLPNDCDKICWLDCDLIFENDNWVNDLSAKLDGPFIFVQPFEMITNLNEDHTIGYSTLAYSNASLGENKQKKVKGTVGFGWAAKLDFIKSLRGFYPFNIIGGGDNFVQMILKACNYINSKSFEELTKHENMSRFNDAQKKHFISYLRTLNSLPTDFVRSINSNSVSFIKGNAFHLWHGNTRDRQYSSRHDILKMYSFNPAKHIYFNNDNCLEWTNDAPKKLKKAVKKYFKSRNEDGKKQ